MGKHRTVVLIGLLPPEIRGRAYFVGLALLKAWAETRPAIMKRFRIEVLEDDGSDPKALLEKIGGLAPDIVGFHYKVCNKSLVDRISRALRRTSPGLKIVLGGPEAESDPRAALTAASADCVVLGEGEETFVELLRAWDGALPLADVAGIAYREGKEVRRTAAREPIPDLDALPSPYLLGRYRREAEKTAGAVLETVRGCPYRCAYCSWPNNRTPRCFSLERVDQEIASILETKPKATIYIADTNLFQFPERGRAVLRSIHKHDPGQQASAWFHMDSDQATPELIQLLNHPGFVCWFGVESSNPAALKAINRRYDEAKIAQTARWVNEFAPRAGRIGVQIILGLPEDDFAGFCRTLDTMYGFGFPHVDVYLLQLIPGTEVARRSSEWGLEAPAAPPYFVTATAKMPAAMLRRAFRIAHGLQMFMEIPGTREALRATEDRGPLSLRAESLLEAFAAAGSGIDREFERHDRRSRRLEYYLKPFEFTFRPKGCDPAQVAAGWLKQVRSRSFGY